MVESDESITLRPTTVFVGPSEVRVFRKLPQAARMPDLQVGDSILICGDVRSWIVTMPILATSRGFEAACAEFGIKTILHSQVTAVYRDGRCLWKEKR
jgi:hypothetical protein